MQVIGCLNRVGDVNQRRELELEVLLQLFHLRRDLLKLRHAVLSEVVHGGLRVVDVNQVLLLAVFTEIRVQLVPL